MLSIEIPGSTRINSRILSHEEPSRILNADYCPFVIATDYMFVYLLQHRFIRSARDKRLGALRSR